MGPKGNLLPSMLISSTCWEHREKTFGSSPMFITRKRELTLSCLHLHGDFDRSQPCPWWWPMCAPFHRNFHHESRPRRLPFARTSNVMTMVIKLMKLRELVLSQVFLWQPWEKQDTSGRGLSFNNCPRNHQFPNAKKLKALSFRHTLLVQCWLLTLSEWKVLLCVLADEGHNFLHFTKRPYCRSRARAKQYTVYISSHSIEFLWSAYHTTDEFTCSKTWQDKNLLPSFQAESWHQWNPWCIQSQNHHMPKGHEHVHHPMGWSTPVLQVGLVFWWKTKQNLDQPWLPESACPPFFSSYPATMSPASKLSWIQSGVVPARNPLISKQKRHLHLHTLWISLDYIVSICLLSS